MGCYPGSPDFLLTALGSVSCCAVFPNVAIQTGGEVIGICFSAATQSPGVRPPRDSPRGGRRRAAPALWGRLGRGGVSGTPDAAVKGNLGQLRVNQFVPRVGPSSP